VVTSTAPMKQYARVVIVTFTYFLNKSNKLLKTKDEIQTKIKLYIICYVFDVFTILFTRY
jgi:hypothetical protein